ncbi:uncharacterized protein [Leuresthes tenuis]|uniref:uncharacterized protein n=1 Tax=Leuresthes tenuis TaxID=355514 RepID=UPI003B504BD6
MFLVLFTVSFVQLGSSSDVPHESECYGNSLKLPEQYVPPLYLGPMYFTPKNGGPRKVLMDNGQSKDPRLKVSYLIAHYTDLTDRDDGTFAITYDGYRLYDVLTLEVRDCALHVRKIYGNSWEKRLQRKVEFVEFTPLKSLDLPITLWNRTNPKTSAGKRLQVRDNMLSIYLLTQADSGHYNFRQKDNTLESRIYLEVTENVGHRDVELDQLVYIGYPPHGGPWTVTLKTSNDGEHEIMRDGVLVESIEDLWFVRRIFDSEGGIEIYPVLSKDSGIVEFRDPDGNLALAVTINLLPEPFSLEFIGLLVGVGGVLLVTLCSCCFCRKKKCCNKNRSAKTPAAPAIYHDVSQPTYPRHPDAPNSSSFPHQHPHHESTATTHEPLMHPPVNVMMTQPEVKPLAGLGSAAGASSGYNFLSSDTEPTFELKGLGSPAATCLSSETPSCDVYNSDKLNFL